MAKKKKRWSDYMWLVSATYFTLGFFNIAFAWLGVICFLIPLLMAISEAERATATTIADADNCFCKSAIR